MVNSFHNTVTGIDSYPSLQLRHWSYSVINTLLLGNGNLNLCNSGVFGVYTARENKPQEGATIQPDGGALNVKVVDRGGGGANHNNRS